MRKIISIILAMLTMLTVVLFTGCAGDEDEILIYAATEEERIAFLDDELKARFPELNINLQYKGSGELYTKLKFDKKDISCDIVFDIEVGTAEELIAETPDLFYDLSDYDYSGYVDNTSDFTTRHKKFGVTVKNDLVFIVNKEVLKGAGASIPQTYNDLLKPEYQDMIVMPNPKISGTGFCFVSGMVERLGETEALAYFDSLDANVSNYTSSGSAPMKSVNTGEAGIGVGMLWQAVGYVNNNDDLQIVLLDNIVPYALYGMAMINGKQEKAGVKDVFDYLFNELNKKCVEEFNTGNVYKDQKPTSTPNFPTGFEEINMTKIYDFEYKTRLMDLWEH